jgi:ABC-type proline/glycine betaine transport system substrate-binding protein
MMKSTFVAMAVFAALLAGPAPAAEEARSPMIVSEAVVRVLSDLSYGEILRQALSKGWHYTPEQIESGYRRHFEEMKLRFIDCGYTILAGEAGT